MSHLAASHFSESGGHKRRSRSPRQNTGTTRGSSSPTKPGPGRCFSAVAGSLRASDDFERAAREALNAAAALLDTADYAGSSFDGSMDFSLSDSERAEKPAPVEGHYLPGHQSSQSMEAKSPEHQPAATPSNQATGSGLVYSHAYLQHRQLRRAHAARIMRAAADVLAAGDGRDCDNRRSHGGIGASAPPCAPGQATSGVAEKNPSTRRPRRSPPWPSEQLSTLLEPRRSSPLEAPGQYQDMSWPPRTQREVASGAMVLDFLPIYRACRHWEVRYGFNFR